MGQRILRITGQLFVDMFGPGKRSYEVIEDPIPDDAKIVNAVFSFGYSSNSDLLVVKLESAEWPDTPDGQLIEEICPKMRIVREC
jgi:hypothetical protein